MLDVSNYTLQRVNALNSQISKNVEQIDELIKDLYSFQTMIAEQEHRIQALEQEKIQLLKNQGVQDDAETIYTD